MGSGSPENDNRDQSSNSAEEVLAPSGHSLFDHYSFMNQQHLDCKPYVHLGANLAIT